MASTSADEIEIGGYRPGALGDVIALHGRYYAEQWGLDAGFEAEVAQELADFLGRLDPARDGFWVARSAGRTVGSISLDASGADSSRGDAEAGARLRWFIVADGLAGKGVGGRLMQACMAQARASAVGRVYLWTFEGLDAARRLYDRFGFELTETHLDEDWGTPVVHQKMELRF